MERHILSLNTHRHMKMHKKGMPGPLWSEDAAELMCALDRQENHLDRSAWKLSPAVCLGIRIMEEGKRKKNSFRSTYKINQECSLFPDGLVEPWRWSRKALLMEDSILAFVATNDLGRFSLF